MATRLHLFVLGFTMASLTSCGGGSSPHQTSAADSGGTTGRDTADAIPVDAATTRDTSGPDETGDATAAERPDAAGVTDASGADGADGQGDRRVDSDSRWGFDSSPDSLSIPDLPRIPAEPPIDASFAAEANRVDLASVAGDTTSGSEVTDGGLLEAPPIETQTDANGLKGVFVPTDDMAGPGNRHCAVLLNNGKVLIVHDGSAELYDPSGGLFGSAGTMMTGGSSRTATVLADGNVLIAGGLWNGATRTSAAEIYDPTSGTFTPTSTRMTTAREGHTATLLPNAKVLIAGGDPYSASAELYDPATGKFATTGTMVRSRHAHTATLLSNSMVLIVGGDNTVATTETYDYKTGKFTASTNATIARAYQTATLLSDGRVFIVGGMGATTIGSYLTNAELYDPTTGTFAPTGNLSTGRMYHTATLLSDGRVLVAGGLTPNSTYLSSAELYDPAIGSCSTTGSLNTSRNMHTATLLPNGKVLVTGGFGGAAANYLKSAELYQ